jgi:hypothetical protein
LATFWNFMAGPGLGVLGILIGLWLHLRGKEHRKLLFTQLAKPLIFPEASEGRTVEVNGVAVPQLNREYVLLFGGGNRTVRFSEAITHIHVRIPKAGRIFAYGVVP